MTNVVNDDKVVKSDILVVSLADPGIFTGLRNLTNPTYEIISKLSFLIGLGRMGYEYGFDIEESVEYSFQDIANFSCNPIRKFDVNTVHKAISELLSKGYLFRDTDGTLAFTPTGSKH